jgi:asparagine synthase (glutamine-hydrolysing)
VAHITGQQESNIWDLLTEFAENAPAMPETNGNRVSQIEQDYYMRNQLLKDTDAMSMWHSLEVRVPYLDKAFLQTMAQISPALKFQLPQKKELLVRAFQKELPEAVWKRPKMGFTFPFAEWFKDSERLLGAQNGLVPWRELFLSGKLSWARLWVLYLSTEPGLMHGWD